MKNNFRNWDKGKHREISSKGGKVKSENKSNAAKIRFRKRVLDHVHGVKNDKMIEGIIEIIKYYRQDKKDWVLRC
jgi:hypothetical protein